MQPNDETMELLSAYIDEELNETEKKQVAAFLNASPEARQHLEEIRATKQLFRHASPVMAPADLLASLQTQAETVMEKKSQRRWSWNWASPWAWTSSLATGVALVAFAVGLRPTAEIPVETLLAAHASSNAVGLHQTIAGASHAVMMADLHEPKI